MDAKGSSSTIAAADGHDGARAPKVSVLLVDDHTLVRQGLRKILSADPEIEIVGEAGDGQSAIESARRLRPSVVVMDIGLPGMNGIEATAAITKSAEGVNVLILSMHADELYVSQGLKAGAHGYLLKDSEDLDLIEGIKSVARGGLYFSASVSKLAGRSLAR
jgi:DNA-binding NarL/FixJ family response regulator